MPENPIWNLLTKLFSVLSAIFLFLGAALIGAAHFGLTANRAAGVLTIFFAVVMAVFSLLITNFANVKLRSQLKEATEIARQISLGERFEEETASELLDALRDISRYMQEKTVVTKRIAGGDLAAKVVQRSDADELGQAFQEMIGKLRALVQTEDERDRLEKSIRKLLREVSEVAAGDLTVQAQVSREMTGAIADAFNRMTRELRSLIKQVKDVTFQVGASANAINETTEQLAAGSEAQASQIARTTFAITEMAHQIQKVSQNASLSAQVAGDSLVNARYGTKAVQDNIGAMNSIRKQVRETAKRIKKLGERSQEISQIVGLLDDLSDRTSLLALNAGLQASTAGESGDGFARVADEVERLAERSNRLTRQIAGLAQMIQSETKDVVASMEETIHEVVVGSTLADKAGGALVEIEQVSQRLAALLQSISESAKQQAKSSEDISSAMENISKVTELVQTGSQRAADSAKMLVALAKELRGSVAPFKLPDDVNLPRRAPTGTNLFVN
ncbi:MAG TPA: methyl-accepting chemotaxis protein [Pyrinomonadaceae bacterium]